MTVLDQQVHTLLVFPGNIHVDMKSSNIKKTGLVDITMTHGLQQTIQDCTREEVKDRKLTRTSTDLTFARVQKRETSAGIIKNSIADHYTTAIGFRMNSSNTSTAPLKRTYISRKKWTNKMNNTNWTRKEEVNNIHMMTKQ